MKNKQKVWIRGVKGRGEEVLNALKALGGKLAHGSGLSGEDSTCIYSITHKGFICAIPAEHEVGKIVVNCYREIKLQQKPWARGTILFSPLCRTFAVCTEKEDMQWCDVLPCIVLSDNDIDFHGCIAKREYRIANKKDRKIFSEWLHNLGYDFDFKTKEVKEWKWRPKEDEKYWVVNTKGFAEPFTWKDNIFNQLRFTFGNCFRTKEEAEAASERVRNALKGGEK